MIFNKFKDCFKKLLNETPGNDSNDQEIKTYHTVDQKVLAPSLDEKKRAIHTLENKKASNKDRINSKFRKIGG